MTSPRNILAELLIEQVCTIANAALEYVSEHIAEDIEVEEDEETETDVPLTYDELLALLFGAQYARPMQWRVGE